MSTTGMHPYVPGNHDKTKRVPSSEVKAPVQYTAETAAGRSSIEVHRSASGSVRELLPKEINDDRFKDMDRRRKRIKCDSCLEVKCGNNVGGFITNFKELELPTSARLARHAKGLDCRWFCVQCLEDHGHETKVNAMMSRTKKRVWYKR